MRRVVDFAKRVGSTLTLQPYQRRFLRGKTRVHCDGRSECARRRRQIAAGTVFTTERLEMGRAVRRGGFQVFGADYSREPDRTEYFPIVISGEAGRP